MDRIKRFTGFASKRFCLLLLISMMAMVAFSPAGALADDDTPTVAFLRFGQHPILSLVDKAVLDVIQAYGYIDAEERATLEGGNDLHGANINILYRDAGFDFPTANLMVEDALDEGADVLLTVSNEVGSIAAAAMSELDDPPALIFAIVTAPHMVGIVESTCVKPANVTGTQMYFDQSVYEELIFLQDPDMDAIGILMDTTDPAQWWFVEEWENYTERYGLRLEMGMGVTISDWQLATQSLMNADVDAIAILPRTSDPARGIAAVIGEAIGVPVYSMIVTDVFQGVTIASGFNGWYSEGHTAGRMLVGYLGGDLDIATTGVAIQPAFATAVNLDTAALQDVVISDAMLEFADFVLDEGEGFGVDIEVPGITTVLEDLSLEERMAADSEFLASLYCSEEMIAEQQAMLDAAADS